MTPEKIYLKGFAGVRDGLHRDEYTLDLTQLPADAQLVAIAGPNGAGKSTLMDNLHPYRLMPSRATSYSPAGFSFYDHLVLPENVKELTWSHAGKRYRSTLVFRINGKRKSEAYLHQEDGGRWVPVKLADGTLSDGKTETYDACLEGLLGTAEVFFTSQFAAQNRRQLSSYTPGQMKTLMVELLGLEQIRKHGDKASKIVTLLKQTLDERRRNHRSLGDPHAAIQAAMEGLARCDTTARELEQEKGTLAAALLAAQHQVASLTATQDAAADTERRRQVLLASLTQRRQETVVAVEQLRQDQTRETGKIQTAEQALVTARDTAQRQRSQSTKGRESAQAILARQDEILGAKTALAALLQDEEKSLRALETAQAVQRDRDAKEQALAVARTRLDAVRQQAGDAALRAEGLKKRLGLTETVPCRGTDLQPQCRLLSDAHEAKVLMPSADGGVARLRTQFDQLQVEIGGQERALASLGNTAEVLARARNGVDDLAAQRHKLESIAALGEALNQAEARLIECARADEETERALADTEQRTARESAEATALIEAIGKRIEERENLGATAQREVEVEIAALPAAFNQSALVAAQQALREAAVRVEVAEGENMTLVQERATLSSALELAKANAAQATTLRTGIDSLEAELGWWNLLAKSLGNDGVIALTIDDAGPELSRLANALLLACYGPRFTVSIRTQVETAKEELREGFDLVVFDADTGQSKSLEVMSGGQRVWINECLMRAIALYLAQSSGRRFDTLFSDEADGPLDPERKRMFMLMKREVLRLGNYRREYFVSQTPELVQLADVVIDLSKTVIPCAEEVDFLT